MRLQIAEALVGTPSSGDRVRVTLDDFNSFRLNYQPHQLCDDYEWEFGDAHLKLKEVLVELRGLAARGINVQFLTCYVDCETQIVVGNPLSLVLVPQGNMSNWPRFQTASSVEGIDIL